MYLVTKKDFLSTLYSVTCHSPISSKQAYVPIAGHSVQSVPRLKGSLTSNTGHHYIVTRATTTLSHGPRLHCHTGHDYIVTWVTTTLSCGTLLPCHMGHYYIVTLVNISIVTSSQYGQGPSIHQSSIHQ